MLKLLVGLILGLMLIVSALLIFESFRTGINPFKAGKAYKLTEVEALADRLNVDELNYLNQNYWQKRVSGTNPLMCIYNSGGTLLDYDGWHNAGADSIFIKLATPDTFKVRQNFMLKSNLLKFTNSNGEKPSIKPNKDFYIIYQYAMWNESYSKSFLQQLKKKCPKNIQIIAVNDDKITE